MDTIVYSKKQMKTVREKYLELLEIVSELEGEFQDRHFTLDGHLVGSIGEVMASYHYGIKLYKAANPNHDGVVDNREVQIKITQQDSVVISGKPDYLIVLYLSKNGTVYEVYNGKGDQPWENAYRRTGYKCRYMRINKLMKMDKDVPDEERIEPKHPIEKMRAEYKNIPIALVDD